MMREDLLKLHGVESVEDLKVWALTTDRTVALAHLQLAPGSRGNWEEVQSKARHLLMMSHGVSHCTVQMESHTQRGTHSCSNCVLTSA
ncbi:zinc transporter 4 [Tachysurus ichikawai]